VHKEPQGDEMSGIDAVAAGHICLDLIPDFPPALSHDVLRTMNPGQLIEVGPITVSTGGPVSNVGLALNRLGVPTCLMGKVGDDYLGKMILGIISRFDPALVDGMIIAEGEVTSYTVVLSPPGVDRAFLHCPGANNTFGPGDVRLGLLREARVFHFGYPPLMRRMFEHHGHGLVELFRRAKTTGITTSLDMAMPDPASESGRADWRRILQATLPYVDIFMPSIEEMAVILGGSHSSRSGSAAEDVDAATSADLSKTAETVLDWGTGIVGLKAGRQGLFLRSAGPDRLRHMGRAQPARIDDWADRQIWSPCFRPRAYKGTTGAGDSTIAGFLAALLRGESLERAASIACAVGACNVEGADSLTGIQTWEATMARLLAGWERMALRLENPAWRHDDTSGLWYGPLDRS
jgi:sugar/nucleoside kinase (ribokinase family)